MAAKTMMALEGHDNQEKGNPFDTEDEELDKTNPFSIDGEPSSPFSESESEITAGSNPDNINNSETTNPFEGGSDDNSNHLQCGSTMTAPTIEIRKASLPGNNSFSSNPFENSVDTEDKYGDCYKDLDNTVGQPDEDETEAESSHQPRKSRTMDEAKEVKKCCAGYVRQRLGKSVGHLCRQKRHCIWHAKNHDASTNFQCACQKP